MDDALSKSLSRIVSDNQKARTQAQQRASRLMDVLVDGSGRDKYTETVNDIIDAATGRAKEVGEVLGADGEAQPTDGDADGSGSQEVA